MLWQERRALSSLLVEGDGVVVAAELGGELAHEDVTDDDVLEVLGKVSSHNAHDALCVLKDGLLKDVIGGGEHVVLAIESEGDVGEGVEVGAVLLDSNTIEERLEEGVGSHDEGGAGVNGGLEASDVNAAVGALHVGEVQVPVALLDDVVAGNLGEAEALIDAGHGHVGLLGVVLEVEGEGLLRHGLSGVHEGGEVINGDLVVGKTNDTVHLGDEEGLSLDLLDLTEAHRGADVIGDLAGVLGDETLNGSGAVGDVEVLAIFLVGGRMLRIVLGVGEAGNGVALAGVDPEVGGTGIGHNRELLVVTAESDVDEVLGVHVVLDGDLLSGGPSLGTADKGALLLHIVGDGEGVVAEGDLVSGDKSEHSGKESSSVHGVFQRSFFNNYKNSFELVKSYL